MLTLGWLTMLSFSGVLAVGCWLAARNRRQRLHLAAIASLSLRRRIELAMMRDEPRGRVRAILDRLFVREDIGIHGSLYLERWHVLHLPREARLYLHRFARSDLARDLHDHPNSFVTLPLVGGYWDETQGGRLAVWIGPGPDPRRVRRLVRWPWPRFRPAEHMHRVQLDPRWPHPWTLVLMFPRRREWGFLTERGWVPADRYIAEVEGGAVRP